jgi:hypothetical protein
MREERIDTGGVPAKLYDPGDAGGLLLFGHGGGHSKDGERVVRMCRRYADQTKLAVVCIDAVDHGERKPNGVSTGLPARWHSTATEQMIEDWQNTVEGLASIGPAAVRRVVHGNDFRRTNRRVTAQYEGRSVRSRWPTGWDIQALLLAAASKLAHPQVLMLNMTQDQLFRTDDTHCFFDAIPGRRKRLMFWESDHDDWPAEAIRLSVDFINEHTR